jgi:hypothetical protein
MILVRTVFQVRQGHIRDLVKMMKQATQAESNRPRILTDLSGPINTMVMEMRHESLAAAERFRTELFQRQSFQAGQNQMNDQVIHLGLAAQQPCEHGVHR